MKKIKLVALFLLIINTSMSSQILKPTEDLALLKVLIVNEKEHPLRKRVEFISSKTKKKYVVNSNKKGEAQKLIPKNDTYSINVGNMPNYDKISIPNNVYLTFEYKIYYDSNWDIKQKSGALLHFSVATSRGNTISEKVELRSKKTNDIYSFQTNANGNADIYLPYNDIYYLSYSSAPNFDIITIPNGKNAQYNYESVYEGSNKNAKYPSFFKSLFNISYINLESKPVKNEEFYLKSKKTSKVYSSTTSNDGIARILVPKGDTYLVSSKYYKNFKKVKIESNEGKYTVNIALQSISTIDYENQQKEIEKVNKIREAKWKRDKAKWGKQKIIDYRTLYYATAINSDTVVLSALSRNKQWKNKLVIVDVTGSMTPYADQVGLWYHLNYAKKEPTQFVLFNDGDGKPTLEKVIGSTGGIHFCKYPSDSQLLDYIQKYSMDSREYEENDIEAILSAIENSKDYSDIILIADNYSPVRDIELVSLIKKPIKIVLCGAKGNLINPDYLNIAYQTNGSIHTIEEDIVNIGESIDGAKIKIGKHVYMLAGGKFYHYKNLSK